MFVARFDQRLPQRHSKDDLNVNLREGIRHVLSLGGIVMGTGGQSINRFEQFYPRVKTPDPP